MKRDDFAGRLIITWPKPSCAALPGWGVVFNDADTGEQILTIINCTIHGDPRGIVTAELEMLADADGQPLASDAKPVLDDSGENILTGVFRWLVAEMRVTE